MSVSSNLTWTVLPGHEARLAPFLETPATGWALEALRTTARREAFRGIARSNERFFVKRFLGKSGIERWRAAKAARQEWFLAEALRQGGARAPRSLALACDSDGGHWIFQDWIEGYPWDRGSREASRRELSGFAALLAQVHALGLRDPDRHAGNFLRDGNGESWAIDFHRARLGVPLLPQERIESLALIESSLVGALETRARARLLRESKPTGPLCRREWILAIESRALVLRARSLRKKARKCFQENRRFSPIAWDSFAGFRRADAAAEAIENACRAWRDGRAAKIKQGQRSAVASIAAPIPLVVKSYRHEGWLATARGVCGWGRARRAWRHAFHLELCGDLGARAIACLEGPGEDLLVSQALSGGESIATAVHLRGERGRRACREVGRFLAQLHAGGLRARDLRPENLHLAWKEERWELRLLDFDGLRRKLRPGPWPQDWGRLFAALPDRSGRQKLRIVRAYARTIFGIAHRPTVRRLLREALDAERAVRERWKRKGPQ